jgi:hypothetical protein
VEAEGALPAVTALAEVPEEVLVTTLSPVVLGRPIKVLWEVRLQIAQPLTVLAVVVVQVALEETNLEAERLE